jgi:hypothetical protein
MGDVIEESLNPYLRMGFFSFLSSALCFYCKFCFEGSTVFSLPCPKDWAIPFTRIATSEAGGGRSPML